MSCEAAFVRLLCVIHDIERHRHHVSLAVPQSPVQDAAFYELSSMLEACFPLFGSLRRETLPSSSSIHSPVVACEFVVVNVQNPRDIYGKMFPAVHKGWLAPARHHSKCVLSDSSHSRLTIMKFYTLVSQYCTPVSWLETCHSLLHTDPALLANQGQCYTQPMCSSRHCMLLCSAKAKFS